MSEIIRAYEDYMTSYEDIEDYEVVTSIENLAEYDLLKNL